MFSRLGPQLIKCPPPPPNGHILGPRDTWDPKQGLLGPHVACDQIRWAGISPRTAPNIGKIHFFGVFGPLWAPGGRKISPSPADPPKSNKVQIATAGGRTVESAKCTKIAQHERVSDRPINSRKLPGGAEPRLKRCAAGNIWFNPGLNPGPHPLWAGDRPPQSSKSRISGKNG